MGIPMPTVSLVDCYKKEAKQLINLSDRIYTQLRELEEELQQRGIGMADYLDSLDGNRNSEPQRSIDDPASARHIQQQIHRLRIEHKRVMEQVESMLHQFHESNNNNNNNNSSNSSERSTRRRRLRWRQPEGLNDDDSSNSSCSSSDDDDDNIMTDPFSALLTPIMSAGTTQLQPFAKVSGVLPGSPASDAGLKRNDLILQFGTITSRGIHHERHTLAAIAQANLDRPLGIKILRNYYEQQTLYPTPKNGWGGPGALGCHILPL